MLTFAFPLALGLLATTLLVGLFYFLRMRFRRQPVSSTYLWSRLIQSTEGGARLRWRSVVLLSLQLLVVVALVFSLAGLRGLLSTSSQPGTLYILDTSASMAAREPGQPSRFELALKALATDRAQAKGAVAVWAGRLVRDREGLDAFLAGLRPGTGEFTEAPVAAALATWLQTEPGSWNGVLLSDGGLDQGGSLLSSVFRGRWRTLPVGGLAPNVGLTDLRVEGGREVRFTLFNGFDAAQALTIELTPPGGAPIRNHATVAPGTSLVRWPWTGRAEVGLWKAAVVHAPDALAVDDTFVLSIEAPRPARVLHLGTPDPYLKAAFVGARYVDRTTASLEGGPWDLLVTDGPVPAAWNGNLVTFSGLPTDSPVFWGSPVSGSVHASGSLALGRWVPWSDVTAREARGLVVQNGATVLAEAGGWPVAAVWDRGPSRVLALGVSTRGSNLGLTPVLPILMRNLRQALVPQEDNPLAANLRVGRPTLRAGSERWAIEPASAVSAVRRGGLWEVTALEAGAFHWTDGQETGVLVASLPAAESDTTPRALVASTVPAEVASPRPQTLPLAPWLALIAAAVLVLEWRLWNGRLSPRANRGLAVWRGLALAAAVLAFAGLELPWPSSDRKVTLLFDASASVGPLLEQERASAQLFLDSLAATDRVALVTFAGQPRVLSGLETRDRAKQILATAPLAQALDPETTDLAAALAAGAQLLAAGPGSGSQVLFSDGRANHGGDLDAVHGLGSRFPVLVVPVGRPLGGVAGRSLALPASVRPGEQAVARWRGEADAPQTVELRWSVDGVSGPVRRVELNAGPNEVAVPLDAGGSGTKRVDVEVRDAQGRVLPSAATGGLLTVQGQSSVLVIRGADTLPTLAQALSLQGLPVQVRGPTGLPDQPAGYQDVSAVVLDNVPATALSAGQQNRLKDWVAGGGGLLVVGGTQSLGRGEYFGTPLEELLPVQSDQRQRLQFTRSRLLFVVDHSGSMSEEVGRTTKLEAALAGIAQSLDQLTAQDEVGLLQFDSTAQWVLPFTSLTHKQTIVDALGRFSQGGGTDLTKALDEVAQAFGRPGPVKRHVILLTDGQTGGEDQFFQDFTDTMKAAQVSVTVLGIGNEVNDSLLGSLASGSDGVYYRAKGDDIPALLHKETVRVTRELIQEGRFPPQGSLEDSVLALGGPPPTVLGYLITTAKPLARVRWQVAHNDSADPLYADWRYGAGKVAVFTSDSGRRWLAPWSGRPEYNRLWGQAVRSLEAGDRDKALSLEVNVSASVAHVAVEAVDDSGRLRSGASLAADWGGRSQPLNEVAPGRYEVEGTLTASGLQLIGVTDRTGNGRTSAWVWNPAGTERVQGGADWSALGRFAASTGGRLEPLASPQPLPSSWTWSPVPLRDALLGLSLALFLLELAVRSTSLGQGKAARALWSAWWADQARPWTKRFAPVLVRDEAEVERRTREAYKYLAQRKRPGA